MLGEQALQYIRQKKEGLRNVIENIARDLQKQAQYQATWRDRTGAARKGIKGGVEEKKGSYTLFLEHTVWYARFLEKGAQPHTIRARRKKRLYWPGALYPVKTVRHPGIRSYEVLAPTVDANISRIIGELEQYWKG